MINRAGKFITMVAVLLPTGCQSVWRQEAKYVDPVLPADMTCGELVHHLNGQHQGLESWRSTSTVMWVRLPNGVRQRLEGVIACRAPQYFRLTAENLIADADLGSNASRCWMYVRPGDPVVVTWRHEDTSLLQQMPTGMPYIDPNWLMLVLGVKPLDANDYEISTGPAGTHELWLTAIENSANGRPLRRVIKVDTVRGYIREHAVYDSEAHPIVRAQLSEHKQHNGHRIPTKVKLEFPQMDSEISLTFRTIETNPHLSDELWKLPERNMQVVDLGKVVRQKLMAEGHGRSGDDRTFQPPVARLKAPQFDEPPRTAFDADARANSFDGAPFNPPETTAPTVAEPEWDLPSSGSGIKQIGYPEKEVTKPKSGWRRFWPFGR